MDPSLYEAIMNDDINVLDEYNSEKLEEQVTPIDETVLHVAAQFGSEKFVKRILEICPSMACRRHNITGNTALHVAVGEGYVRHIAEGGGRVRRVVVREEYVRIAKAILECGRDLESGHEVTHELLRATNKVGDTGLHLAVRRKRPLIEMVKLLLEKDSELQLRPNNAGEIPLYIAAEMGHAKVMAECLENCTSLAMRGPFGRTALHGAIISSSKECIKLLLDAGHKYGIDLIKVKDVYGWTPLHYAARNGDSVIAKLILEREKSAAYIGTENDNNTPLHLAAAAGSIKVIKKLLSFSPDCWRIVNKKGYNVLHVAVDVEQEKVLKYMVDMEQKEELKHMKDLPILGFLINQQDKDGNTPLHLLAKKKKREWYGLLRHDLANGDIFNNQNLRPVDLWPGDEFDGYYGRRDIFGDDFNIMKNFRKRCYNTEEGRKAKQQEILKTYKENMKKMGETHLIVATLVTTITFTAAFTIPGGYDGNPGSNQGLAILTKTKAFKIFVLANSIALVSSLISVIIYIVIPFCYYSNAEAVDGNLDRDPYMAKSIAIRYMLAVFFIMIAIGSMMIAFVSGTCGILAHSLDLANYIITIGCLALTAYVLEVIKILRVIKSYEVF